MRATQGILARDAISSEKLKLNSPVLSLVTSSFHKAMQTMIQPCLERNVDAN